MLFRDLMRDLDFEITKVLGPRNVPIVTKPLFVRDHVKGGVWEQD